MERVESADPGLRGRVLHNAGNCLRVVGQVSAARTHVQLAITLGEAAEELNYQVLSARYSSMAAVELAAVELEQGNADSARSMMQRAIELGEKAYGSDDSALAFVYSNLAMVELELGNLDAARSLMPRAIEIHENTLGPNDPAVAVDYSNLGAVELMLGNRTAAEDHLKRAISVHASYVPTRAKAEAGHRCERRSGKQCKRLTISRSPFDQIAAYAYRHVTPRDITR